MKISLLYIFYGIAIVQFMSKQSDFGLIGLDFLSEQCHLWPPLSGSIIRGMERRRKCQSCTKTLTLHYVQGQCRLLMSITLLLQGSRVWATSYQMRLKSSGRKSLNLRKPVSSLRWYLEMRLHRLYQMTTPRTCRLRRRRLRSPRTAR